MFELLILLMSFLLLLRLVLFLLFDNMLSMTCQRHCGRSGSAVVVVFVGVVVCFVLGVICFVCVG